MVRLQCPVVPGFTWWLAIDRSHIARISNLAAPCSVNLNWQRFCYTYIDSYSDRLVGVIYYSPSHRNLPLRTNFRTVQSSRTSANRIEFEPWLQGFESMADSIR